MSEDSGRDDYRRVSEEAMKLMTDKQLRELRRRLAELDRSDRAAAESAAQAPPLTEEQLAQLGPLLDP